MTTIFTLPIYALLLAAMPMVSFAEGGVSGSGGGNSLASTPADVKAVVNGLKQEGNLLGIISEAQTRQYLTPDYVSDPDIKKLLRAFTQTDTGLVGASGVALVQDAMASSLEPRTRCLHSGESSDATTGYYRQAPVCFSTKRLSRHPKENLREEVAILLMHELAHHFVGDNEKVANKFQNYMAPFIREFLRNGDFAGDRRFRNVFEMRPGGAVRVKSDEASTVVRCVSKGEMSSPASNNGGELQILVQPGQPIALGSGDDLTMVTCKSLPTADCSVKEINGQRQVVYGDIPGYWSWLPGDADARIRFLQAANICKREATRAVPADEEKNNKTAL